MKKMSDFYDGFAEETDAKLKKMQTYVSMAIDNGDAIIQTKPGVLEITIRIKKDGRIQDSESK